MRIFVPRTFGPIPSTCLPDGRYQAHIECVTVSRSDLSGEPKATVYWVVDKGKYAGRSVPAVYSLESQGLWRLNCLYRLFSGRDLEGGTYTQEEMESMLSRVLVGQRASITVTSLSTPDGIVFSHVRVVRPEGARSQPFPAV